MGIHSNMTLLFVFQLHESDNCLAHILPHHQEWMLLSWSQIMYSVAYFFCNWSSEYLPFLWPWFFSCKDAKCFLHTFLFCHPVFWTWLSDRDTMSSFLLNDRKEFLLTILFLKRKKIRKNWNKMSFVSSIPPLGDSF